MSTPQELRAIIEGALDPDKFEAWLKSRLPSKQFTQRSGCFCPLAQYLTRLLPGSLTATVSSYYVRITQLPDLVPLPTDGWAQRFVNSFDHRDNIRPMLRDDCLRILAEVR